MCLCVRVCICVYVCVCVCVRSRYDKSVTTINTNLQLLLKSSVLQCAAVCCSVLQCVAMWCSVSWCVAVLYPEARQSVDTFLWGHLWKLVSISNLALSLKSLDFGVLSPLNWLENWVHPPYKMNIDMGFVQAKSLLWNGVRPARVLLPLFWGI